MEEGRRMSYIARVIDEEEEFDREKWIEEFEGMTKDAERIQNEVLKKILEQNAETEYLKKHGLNGRTDLESFKTCIPLITYADIETYITRMADGETSSLLTRKPITSFAISTGTSNGKSKLVPYRKEKMDSGVMSKLTSYAYRSRNYPIDEKKKTLMFVHLSPKIKTKGGFDAAPGTSFFFNDERIKLCYRTEFCCPKEVMCASNTEEAIYCHLLCGLIYRDEVQNISSTFPHNIIIAFESLKTTWEELCNDIKTGILSNRITDSSLRISMSSCMKPDQVLADTIYSICIELSEHCWYDVIPKLFPNAKYVLAIITGCGEKYVGRLREFAGELPLFSEDYVSSEARVGANTNPSVSPELTTYVVLPNLGYFEFLPIKGITKNQQKLDVKPLNLTEVKLGEEYEVVITNFIGLYRYKLGDIVKVVGFFNSTPRIKFICRANVILSISIENTSEKDLQDAVEAALELLDNHSKLVDYTSYAEESVGNKHYVIFWELNDEVSDSVLSSCCNRLDSAIPGIDYSLLRKRKEIGPLELRIVRSGTSSEVPEQLMKLGVSTNQFKLPKCLKTDHLLKIFNDRVVKRYFSSAYE